MSELGLNDFLSQLGNETVNRLNRESRSRMIPGVQQMKEEQHVEMPQRRERKPEPVRHREPEPEMEQEIMNEDALEEDFIETALDYASVIVKTVRQSFDSKAEKRKVFESIRSAIDIYLEEYQPQQRRQSYQSSPSLFQGESKMSEKEFDAMPKTSQEQIPGSVRMQDLSGQQVNISQQQPKGVMESNMNIGVTIGHDGKKHADLSRMTDIDVHSLRVLSGIEEAPK